MAATEDKLVERVTDEQETGSLFFLFKAIQNKQQQPNENALIS